MIVRTTALALLFTLSLAFPSQARPPTDSFSANLDRDCEPYDVVDWLRSIITPKVFWLEQEKDFQTFVKATTTNLLNARLLLNENRDGVNAFRAMVAAKAQELGIRGDKATRMMAENMEKWDEIAETFKKNIKANEAELAWAQHCLFVATQKLRSMGFVEIGR